MATEFYILQLIATRLTLITRITILTLLLIVTTLNLLGEQVLISSIIIGVLCTIYLWFWIKLYRIWKNTGL